MKILQVHAGYRFAAGEDTVVAIEADALRDAGHLVEQFIVPNPEGTAAALGALATSVHNRAVAARFEAVVREFGPDLVHVHNTWFSISSAPVGVAFEHRVPVVMTLHNYRLGCLSTDLFRDGQVCTACVGRAPWAGVRHGCYRGSRALSAIQAVEVVTNRRRRVLIDGVTTFVAPSDFMAARLVDIGVPSRRLVVKPHFTADPGERASPPSESNEVLFVGRLAPGKGTETMLDAWSRFEARAGADRELSDLRLVVLGDGPLAESLREAAPLSVHFDGWQSREQVLERLLRSRAVLFPSEWYEPFGMVLIEALSAGLPIITSNASAAPSIAGSPDELVVPAGDATAMSTAIGRLTDSGYVDTVGAASRRRYGATFSVPAGLAALESLYAQAMRRPVR